MTPRTLYWATALVIGLAVVALVPAFLLPLGLPTELDAVAYRIPIIKWMLRHGAYPNWSWTYVDDYPMLGELLMLPLWAIKENLARVVPIFFYFACAVATAALTLEVFPPKDRARREQFLFILACALSLRPVLLQSNALMLDNVATAFSLGALYFCIRKNSKFAVLNTAFALATRYSTWGIFLGVVAAAARMNRRRFWILFLSLLGALPFMARNLLLNHNPFFPLLQDWFQGQVAFPFDSWGRGTGPLALLLFPYDLIFTNSFVSPLFDVPRSMEIGFFPYHFTQHTVGLFFQTALALFLIALVREKIKNRIDLQSVLQNHKFQASLLFMGCHFLVWWFGSQQLKFLGPELLWLTGLFSVFIYRRLHSLVSVFVLVIAMVSITESHLEVWKLAMGGGPMGKDLPYVKEHLNCVARLNQKPGELVGLKNPAFVLGYGDYDFMYLPPHPYYFPSDMQPDYLVDEPIDHTIAGYIPWPTENPCAFKKVSALELSH